MDKPWWHDLNRFSFGNTPTTADELLGLVLLGVKTGTSWRADEGEQTVVGQRHVVLDGRRRPRAVLETIELRRIPYMEVDAEFARDSGEGERTLASWREDYRSSYGRQGRFSEDMEMYCERFRLIEVIEVAEDTRL